MIEIKVIDRFSPSLLKQYIYCPVIPWINSFLMIKEPTTDSMKIGLEECKPPQDTGQLYLRNKRGSSIIDEITNKRGSRVIIERKKYASHNYSRYTAQVVASYLIARVSLPGIRYAMLEVSNKQLLIELNEDLVEDVEKLIEKLEKVLTREKPPDTKPSPAKCKSCWYMKYCPHS